MSNAVTWLADEVFRFCEKVLYDLFVAAQDRHGVIVSTMDTSEALAEAKRQLELVYRYRGLLLLMQHRQLRNDIQLNATNAMELLELRDLLERHQLPDLPKFEALLKRCFVLGPAEPTTPPQESFEAAARAADAALPDAALPDEADDFGEAVPMDHE